MEFIYDALGVPIDYSDHIYTRNFKEFLHELRNSAGSNEDRRSLISDSKAKKINHQLPDIFQTVITEEKVIHYGWLKGRSDSVLHQALFADLATDISIMRFPIILESALEMTRNAYEASGSSEGLEETLIDIKKEPSPIVSREKIGVVAQLGGLWHAINTDTKRYEEKIDSIKSWHDRLIRPNGYEEAFDRVFAFGGRKDPRLYIGATIYGAIQPLIGNADKDLIGKYLLKAVSEVASSNDVLISLDQEYWSSAMNQLKNAAESTARTGQIDNEFFTARPMHSIMTSLDKAYFSRIFFSEEDRRNVTERWDNMLSATVSHIPYSAPFKPAAGLRELN
ncbi:MAG: hypothetical protein NDI94_00945 [Candidatus Woesearchaeota archaeon]|nr:hypothetical protein [Candidatus Woesearchaeota archaeon]